MKLLVLSLAAVATFAFCGLAAEAQKSPLVLETKIQLGDVRGRIDHMAIDLARRRLFVAELENDSVAVVDLDARKVIQVITDAKRPQGLGYLLSTDMLYVANGGDGSLRIFQGNDLRMLGQIALGDDADNIRVDAESDLIFVAYGDGALAIVDPTSRRKVDDIRLTAHPESFQIDRRTNRIYVNNPKQQSIVVIDRISRRPIATWSTGNATNFPMALNEAANHVLVVFRSPAKLVAFAALNGAVASSTDTCGDADDMFVDAKRQRLYVSCGDGFLDVFDIKGGAYQRIARMPTVTGARTALYVAELDRLFVAARAAPEEAASIWVFRPEAETPK